MAEPLRKIFQLKVSLKGAKPPIWRRFFVESTITLPKLHTVLQVVMGWTDTHLHQFTANEEYYGVPDPDFDFSDIMDERKYRLSHLMKKEKDLIGYEYDFGDGWQHIITLEKILPFDTKTRLPFCIKAKGACPPEDVGGIWGYYDLLEALADENHPEHEEIRDWLGEDFDPGRYDIDEVNKILLEYCR